MESLTRFRVLGSVFFSMVNTYWLMVNYKSVCFLLRMQKVRILIHILLLEEELEKKLYYLIIFDDMQEQFYKGGYLENFLCKCRHWGITIWVCAQYAYAISKKSRQQFSCFIMFPMLSNEEDREIIGETAPGSKKQYKIASDVVMKISKEQNNVRNFLFINKSLADKYWFNFEFPIEISIQ